MLKIDKMSIKGYKSIKDCKISLNDINVIIGANGAWKSNFISVFKMLQNIFDGSFQSFVSKNGEPDFLLHFGRKQYDLIGIEIMFSSNGYGYALSPTMDNRMMFDKEWFYWKQSGKKLLGSGHFESLHDKGTGTVWYNKLRAEIKNLCDNKAFYTTTMFDYYALPQDVPGRKNPVGATMFDKVLYVESEWQKDICEANFITNVIMHEFEGLLFSDPDRFSFVDSRRMKLREMQEVRRQFETPEHINDSIDTAPSKRIINIYPEYDKVLHGTRIAIDIGYDSIMSQCKHFSKWIHKLENLNQ